MDFVSVREKSVIHLLILNGYIQVYMTMIMITMLFSANSRIKMNYNVFTLRIRKTLKFTVLNSFLGFGFTSY